MAAPTSNNEVTARRLTRLLTGSDGNGGLWGKVKDKISSSINALDVSSVGGAGKYISAISETDGKISATATTMDTTPTASSTNAVTSGGVKTALDGKLNTSGGAMTGAITRDISSSGGVISDTNLLTVTGSTDGFKVDYGAATSDVGVTKIYTTDDANAKISIGNYNSSYKEAIGITNGSAALSNTPTAPTAAAGTNTTQIATTAFVTTAVSNSNTPNRLYANAQWGGAFRRSLAPGDTYFLQQRNCFFGAPATSIQVEYSNDGGTTWVDYGLTDSQKIYLFSQFNGNTVSCGKALHVHPNYTGSGTKDLSNANIADQRLRITICNQPISQYGTGSLGNQWMYCNLRRIGIFISTQSVVGSSTHCVFSGMKRENFKTGTNTWETFGDYNIQGDSGWNSIPCKNATGESSVCFGANFDGQYAMLRFEVWATQLSSSPNSGQTGDIQVSRILGFSELCWVNNSKNPYVANYGYPCAIDATTGIANFPKGIAGALTGNASTSSCPAGFDTRPASTSWGTLTSANGYTYVTNWRTASAAEISFAEKSGALYTQIDGVFYQREGGKRVLDVSDINSSFYAPTGAGTSGQILKSSGSGAPTWATANAALVGITVTSTSVSDGTTTFNKYTHPTTSGNKHVPTGGSSGQFLGWSADGTAAWVANPNTDTKVTAVGNHYTPSGGTSKDASGGSATQLPTSSTGSLTQVVTGVTVDAAGHVTGVSSKGLWSPNNTYNFSGTTFYSGNQSNAEHNANNIASNGVYYWTSNGPTTTIGWTPKTTGGTETDGAIYAQAYSASWVGQIAQDYRNGNLAVRGKNNGTWTDWKMVLTSDSTLDASKVSGTVATATTATKLGSSTLGSGTKPIYLSSGTATECSTYAGGTAVTLNNVSKAASSASFYAPTAGGTSNYVLIGQGTTSAPVWAEKAPKATTTDKAEIAEISDSVAYPIVGSYNSTNTSGSNPSTVTGTNQLKIVSGTKLWFYHDSSNGYLLSIGDPTGDSSNPNPRNGKIRLYNGANSNYSTIVGNVNAHSVGGSLPILTLPAEGGTLVALSYGNELNLPGSDGNLWINYRNVNNGSDTSQPTVSDYWFCNRNGGASTTIIHAGSYQLSRDKASISYDSTTDAIYFTFN